MCRLVALMLAIRIVCPDASIAEPQRSLPATGSGKNTLRVSAGSLGPIILNRNVELMTRDGTYVKGRVIGASVDAIRVRIKLVEPANRIPGPEAKIRPADISVVYLRRAGSPFPAIGLGILGGCAAAGPLAAGADPDAENAGLQSFIIFSAMAMGATGGVLLGRKLAQKTIVIEVTPNP